MKLYFLTKKLVILNFLASLRNYLKLYKAGLRIGSWHDEHKDHRYSRYRCFWKDELIRDIPDIVRVDDKWSLVNNGRVENILKPNRIGPQYYSKEWQIMMHNIMMDVEINDNKK